MSVLDLGIDGFEDFEEIGHGGFSRVYKCVQQPFNRIVALKVFTGIEVGIEDTSTYQRECRAVGALHWHRNIVTVFGAGVSSDGHPYLAMEYAPGGSLASHLNAVGVMPEPQVVRIGAKIASALQAAHEAGVLHRDVKPANILVGEGGEPLLADFGIASVSGTTVTATGGVSATLIHAAPEVLDGDRPSVASDVYSLGSTLFTLLIGRPPFSSASDDSVAGLITRTLTAPLPDLRKLRVSDATASVIERSMDRDPARRYATAGEFAAALNTLSQADLATVGPGDTGAASYDWTSAQATTDETVAKVDPAKPVKDRPTVRRRKRPRAVLVVALGAAAAIIGVAVGLVATSGSSKKPGAAPSTTAPNHVVVTTVPVPRDLLRPSQIIASATSRAGKDNCGFHHPFNPPEVYDGSLQTAWAAPVTGLGQTTLTFEFGRAVRVTSIDIVPGYARNDTDCSGVDRWYQNSRVKKVEYGFSDGKVVDASFNTDKAVFQPTKIGNQVTTVLHIRPLALAAPGGPLYLSSPKGEQWPKNLLAPNFMISEIEVHGSVVDSSASTTAPKGP